MFYPLPITFFGCRKRSLEQHLYLVEVGPRALWQLTESHRATDPCSQWRYNASGALGAITDRPPTTASPCSRVTRLQNPPIVELFLAVAVEPSSAAQPWSENAARQFALSANDPEVQWERSEINVSQNVQFAEVPNSLPRVERFDYEIDWVRLFDSDRTICIQYDRSQIVYNSLRAGTDYPGFAEVFPAAGRNFEKYIDFFRPQRIKHATVGYVDMISIPVGQEGTIQLTDFFNLGIDPDEGTFGVMKSYELRAAFDNPLGDGHTAVTIQSVPGAADPSHVQLRMEWQQVCIGFATPDLEAIKSRLNEGKQHLSTCFRKSFTEDGWKLFQPLE